MLLPMYASLGAAGNFAAATDTQDIVLNSVAIAFIFDLDECVWMRRHTPSARAFSSPLLCLLSSEPSHGFESRRTPRAARTPSPHDPMVITRLPPHQRHAPTCAQLPVHHPRQQGRTPRVRAHTAARDVAAPCRAQPRPLHCVDVGMASLRRGRVQLLHFLCVDSSTLLPESAQLNRPTFAPCLRS
jgi:hypothetical protein